MGIIDDYGSGSEGETPSESPKLQPPALDPKEASPVVRFGTIHAAIELELTYQTHRYPYLGLRPRMLYMLLL